MKGCDFKDANLTGAVVAYLTDEEKADTLRGANTKDVFLFSRCTSVLEKSAWNAAKLFGYKVQLSLLYRGSRDGFDATSYHTKVDKKGPLLTLITTASSGSFLLFFAI